MQRGGALTAGILVGDLSPLFVVPFFAGLLALAWLAVSMRESPFLAGASLLFFGMAVIIFFAGAQRYLLPMAAPLSILACLQLRDRPRLLWAGFAFQLVLGIAAATVNLEHWNQTRAIARAAAALRPRGRLSPVSGASAGISNRPAQVH